jgi:hypothetical protein
LAQSGSIGSSSERDDILRLLQDRAARIRPLEPTEEGELDDLRNLLNSGLVDESWEYSPNIDSEGRRFESAYLAHISLGPCAVWAPDWHEEQTATAKYIFEVRPEVIRRILVQNDQLSVRVRELERELADLRATGEES